MYPTFVNPDAFSPRAEAATSRFVFAASVLIVAGGACLLAGWFPLGVSIVAVFMFAGPHNWMEARYLMTRMPARWGTLRWFFLTGICGVVGLTASFASLTWLARWAGWLDETSLMAVALWNTALVGWILALVQLRSQQNPRRDWGWTVPVGMILIAPPPG